MLGWSTPADLQKLWRCAISALTQERTGVEDEDAKLEVETIRALTTLLLQSRLAIPGNPLTTFPHLPRQRTTIFLKNSLGRRLFQLRQVVESYFATGDSGTGMWTSRSADLPGPAATVATSDAPGAPVGRQASESSSQEGKKGGPSQAEPFFRVNAERFVLPPLSTRLRYGQVAMPLASSSGSKSQDDPSHAAQLKALLDMLGERVRGSQIRVSPLVRKESLKAILLLSDIFPNKPSFEWMFLIFFEVLRNAPAEDALLVQYALLGVCKAVATLKTDTSHVTQEVVAALDRGLRDGAEHPAHTVAAVHGILHLLDGKCVHIVKPLLPALVRHLSSELQAYSAQAHGSGVFEFQPAVASAHLMLTFLLIEEFPKELEEMEFVRRPLHVACGLALREAIPDQVFHTILRGLERLLLSFSLGHLQRDEIWNLNLDKVLTSWSRALSFLNFLLTCVYTGQIGAPLNPALPEQKDLPASSSSSSLVSDKVMVMFERLRSKAGPREAIMICNVLPHVLVDFLPAQQILTTAVSELLLLQAYNPHLATVLHRVFQLLGEKDPSNTAFIVNWILLSLNSFVQMPRADLSIWCLTCLFTSVSRNSFVKSL